MKHILMILAYNVPSLAFLASAVWCLHSGHPVFATWLLVFSICTHAYPTGGGDGK